MSSSVSVLVVDLPLFPSVACCDAVASIDGPAVWHVFDDSRVKLFDMANLSDEAFGGCSGSRFVRCDASVHLAVIH